MPHWQRHLLGEETPTLELVVRAGNDFSQIQSPSDKTRITVGSVDAPTFAAMTNTEAHSMARKMTEKIEQLQKRQLAATL